MTSHGTVPRTGGVPLWCHGTHSTRPVIGRPNACDSETNAGLNCGRATSENFVTLHGFGAGSAQNAPEYWTFELASVALTRVLSCAWRVPPGAVSLAASMLLSVEPYSVQAHVERFCSATDQCASQEALFSYDLSGSGAPSR